MAVLFVRHTTRGAGPVPMQVPRWQRGMHEYVEVKGGVTLSAVERLAAHLGTGYGHYTFSSDQRFASDGGEQVDGLQFRGSGDHQRVAAAIVSYAANTIGPWVETHTDLDRHLASGADLQADDPIWFDGQYAPMLLIAAGRTSEALARLNNAERHPEFDRNSEHAEDVASLREFIQRGETIPPGSTELFARSINHL